MIGFATPEDAQRAVRVLQAASAVLFNPNPGGRDYRSPIQSMVRPKAGAAPAGYSLGEVVWFDPGTDAFAAAGGDVLLKWPSGATADAAAQPSIGQYAGTKDYAGTTYGVYSLPAGAAGGGAGGAVRAWVTSYAAPWYDFAEIELSQTFGGWHAKTSGLTGQAQRMPVPIETFTPGGGEPAVPAVPPLEVGDPILVWPASAWAGKYECTPWGAKLMHVDFTVQTDSSFDPTTCVYTKTLTKFRYWFPRSIVVQTWV